MASFDTYSEDVSHFEVEVDSFLAEVKVCGSDNVCNKEISLIHPCQEVLDDLVNDADLQDGLQQHEAPFQLVLHDAIRGQMIPDVLQTLYLPFSRHTIVGIEIRPVGKMCYCSFVEGVLKDGIEVFELNYN